MDTRSETPLRMLPGNMDALLENEIEVRTISLRHDAHTEGGVILMVTMTEEQRLAAAKVGFKTGRLSDLK